ncbi:MAG: DUF1841 family protein [Neisseriaceae bacterium]|jgi:hypothetical protein
MFNPSQADVRNFFFTVYEKHKAQANLEDLERIALSVILEHPEYDKYLSNREKYINHQWLPEHGETNPFLHLSMHMSIIEQLSINQPFGITDLYKELCKKFGSELNAQHEMMDCLAEMLWQAQKNNLLPDLHTYLECIKNKLSNNS